MEEVSLADASTGKRDDPLMQLHLHEYELPPLVKEIRPDVPEIVSHVVARALSKEPNDRFSTCREFATAMAATLDRVEGSRNPAAVKDVHISGMSSDSLTARRLATSLETTGYAVWYYQRDGC